MKIEAFNAHDLLIAVDPGTSDRAGACSPALYRFDPETATLYFATRCAGSGNTWEQEVQLFDFNYVVPEEERENMHDWDQLKSAYPDIIGSDLKLHCNCLTGDTKIPLLDGRVLTLEEIHKEFGSDKYFWLYSTDKNGDFKPGKALSLGITKLVNKLYIVTLDNGKKIKCTEDHPFMLRDGTYKLAKNLAVNESLMPLYFRDKNVYSKSSTREYKQYKVNSSGKWKFVFRAVADECFPDEKINKEKLEKTVAVHHKDFDQGNNSPGNLQWMGRKEHLQFHVKLAKKNSCLQKLWDDRREEMLAHVKEAGKTSYGKNSDNIERGRLLGIAWTRTPEGRKELSNRKKRFWSDSSEERINACVEKRKETVRNDSTLRQKLSDRLVQYQRNLSDKQKEERNKRLYKNIMGAKPISDPLIGLKRSISKIMKMCYRTVYICELELTEENYDKCRSIYTPKSQQKITDFFEDFTKIMYWWGIAERRILNGKYKPMFTEDLERCAQEVLVYLSTQTYGDCVGCGKPLKWKQRKWCSLKCKKTKRICGIEGCNKIYVSKGLCKAHYEAEQYKRPEVRARHKEYHARKDVKIRKKAYMQDYLPKYYERKRSERELQNHKVTTIEVEEFNKPIPVYDLTVQKWENFLVDAGVIVHNCPAFLFFKQYLLTDLDVVLQEEHRFPAIRNPSLEGTVCKHLAAALRSYF